MFSTYCSACLGAYSLFLVWTPIILSISTYFLMNSNHLSGGGAWLGIILRAMVAVYIFNLLTDSANLDNVYKFLYFLRWCSQF